MGIVKGRPPKTKIIIKREDRMNFILNGVSDYYQTPIKEIMKYARMPEKVDRKRIVIKLLKDIADIEPKDISSRLNITEVTISNSYRSINEDISSYRFKELKNTYNDIIKHLGL